ncbi:MAG: hypothetical protein ACLSHU_13305 [Oscillospiraceae bacterium]
MSYEIIRGPFILMETVEMLYKYVNNISFLNIASRLRLLRGGMDAEMQRRMERLQKLTQEVCGGLDPNDPVLRKYFEKVATDCYLDDTCLALMLTCSFCSHEGAGSSGETLGNLPDLGVPSETRRMDPAVRHIRPGVFLWVRVPWRCV